MVDLANERISTVGQYYSIVGEELDNDIVSVF